LLSAFGITGPRLERLDQEATEARLDRAVDRLRDGESAAYVSDAGTPGVSDPVGRLVARIVAGGEPGELSIHAVPGPSAVAALVSVGGFEGSGFRFRGFFPREARDREEELRR